MAYVMLYGIGWTQRWQVADGAVELVSAEINKVGSVDTGRLLVLDPGTNLPATLVVAWQHVAAAVVLGSESLEADGERFTGQYS